MALTHAWHDLVHDMRDEVRDLGRISRVTATRQAYLALRITFMALPLLFGLDKFATVLTERWEGYLATWANDIIPGTAAEAMLWIGAVEIVLAVLVFAAPRIGGDVLAAWFVLTAVNLFSMGDVHEIGLAMPALAACCLAMARMSTAYHHREG